MERAAHLASKVDWIRSKKGRNQVIHSPTHKKAFEGEDVRKIWYGPDTLRFQDNLWHNMEH